MDSWVWVGYEFMGNGWIMGMEKLPWVGTIDPLMGSSCVWVKFEAQCDTLLYNISVELI